MRLNEDGLMVSTKCQKCGNETKELFENTFDNGTKWYCRKCSASRYTRSYPPENTKLVRPPVIKGGRA